MITLAENWDAPSVARVTAGLTLREELALPLAVAAMLDSLPGAAVPDDPGRWLLAVGDVERVCAELPGSYFDGILCDPPYGLEFMARDWDAGVPSAAVWAAIRRCCKPGAFLLAFGGTRTFHRLACAIEDGGWRLKDTCCWLSGSGFPKSHSIDKAIDAHLGKSDERQAVGDNPNSRPNSQKKGCAGFDAFLGSAEKESAGVQQLTAPASQEAQSWLGYGTALKPAYEMVLLATNALTFAELCETLALKVGGALCRLAANVKGAEKSLPFSLSGLPVDEFDSVLWNAVASCSSLGALFDLMATSLSRSTVPMTLSIGWSWLRILDDLCSQASTFTTEMAIALTTDLRILNSCPSAITPDSIIQAAICQHGNRSNVCPADAIFSGVKARLSLIHTVSVRGAATLPGVAEVLHPDQRSIFLFQAPIEGTYAQNCLAYGCGGLNVDGCRIKCLSGANPAAMGGRWPANLLLSHTSDCVCTGTAKIPGHPGYPNGPGGKSVHYSDATSRGSEVRPEAWPGHADADGNETVETWDCTPDCPVRLLDEQSGGASRFFYCAKASKKEREAGLAQREPKKVNDGRDTPIDNAYQRGETARCNVHPTVKPLDLCRYLATLILPPPRLGETRKLLTPFSGSGSEMIAAQQAGWDETWGIEQSPEYVEIAAARLRHWLAGGKD